MTLAWLFQYANLVSHAKWESEFGTTAFTKGEEPSRPLLYSRARAAALKRCMNVDRTLGKLLLATKVSFIIV